MGGRTGLRRSTRLPLAVTVLLAVVGAIVAPSTAAHAAAGLTATFSSSDNGSWRMDKYVISNPTTTAISGWTLEFDLPAGVTMGNAYHGTVTRVGNRVTVVNAHYNGTVAAGGSTEPYSFWFIATGTAAAPTNCRVNGNKCDGSPDRAPGTPTGLTVSGRTTKTLSLTWAAATATDFPIAGYDVLRGGTVVASVTGTAATVGGLTPNTSYTFAVVAKDTRGNVSPASAAVSATTLNPADDTVAPPAPGGLRSTAVTAASVTLAWNAVNDASGIAGYDVYRGTQLAATVNGTGTSITVGGLTPLTAYTFTVRARDTYDNVSPASASVTVTTDDVMGAGRYAKVGYFVQWGIYGRQYFVKNLDTSGAAAKLTHINYAFANLDPVNLTCLQGVTRGTTPNPQDPDQGTGAGDADADYGRPFSAAQSVDGVADTGWEKLRGNFNQLKKLKAKHPHLKILISLGGWTYSKYFSDAAATPASREKLVRSCLDIYLRGNLPVAGNAGGPGTAAGIFDGIDLDWEWPGAEGHPGNHWGPQDKANNTALLAEFRRQMDELGATTGKRYLLTAFTPADPAKIDAGWDISRTDGTPSVFDYLDFANVQGYDFHGAGSDNSWEPNRTGHQGNLYRDAQDPYPFEFSVERAVRTYTDAGVNPRQLTVGFAFYGRGWQGVAAGTLPGGGSANGEWQTATGAAPGQFAEEAGTRGYANLLAMVPGCTVQHDTQSVSSYCFTGNGGQWWTFDDPWAIGQKTTWAKQQNLLGGMIWEMSGDTTAGTLMSAVDTGLPSPR
ncbi:glycoside hydrolase family 18 chitinase [Micromonospora peucetia]|uniref:chitinase n=1 Tax=Micromonospora peucetia TaxID=47871 RepID=A0A1C6TYX4_9ACTN|nr:glycosyl hydrolase family 18 protein [Micromonospora peucetia]MCX4385774.1 glycoside hydrolase family 18 chitinase [Micromonospora peucetia]WSA33161.1 glycoside hydrolase family 18 chitinase [Micromonospora peucetia]SCL47032.1 chitinase family 18 [Micromonospora peucetia]